MKVIIEAMLYQEHLSENEILKKGTWKTFFKEAEKKKIIVFGAGRAAKKFVGKFLRGKEIFCFLDNDEGRQGSRLNGVPIKAPSDLTEEAYAQSVVLITSTVYMNEIAEQLEKMGVKHYYGVLAMEAKRLKNRLPVCFFRLALYCFLPVSKNKILLKNGADRYYCNLKYVAQALHEKYPKYRLVWVTDHGKGYPDYVKCVKNTKLGFLYHAATAKVYAFNDVQHYGITKRKRQYFINTWHGCVALKRIGLYTDLNSRRNYCDVTETSAKTDLFISNGAWCSNMYRESFRYQGKILEAGTPRLDILFRSSRDLADKMRAKFKIPPGAEVILYAPTFRGKGIKASLEIDMVMMDFVRLRTELCRAYEKDVYILLRLHPFIVQAGGALKESEGIINVTDHDDVYEIMLLSDTLITDYSSLMFEASYVGQKVYLYASDVEHYVKEERGHYFNYYELPYPIASTEEELIENMRTIDYAEVEVKVKEFIETQLGLKESGKASEMTADAIDTMIRKGIEAV